MIDFNIGKIVPLCEDFGLSLDETAQKRLNTYGNMLVEYNKKVNLTAITEPEEVLYKHFYDCLLFFKNIEVKNGAEIIDVGTGAGFPGLVLKIARPDIKLTLLDGLNKRLDFLKAVLDEIGLEANLVHSRAEDGGKNAAYRERFDIATARAVANLPVLSELCVPYVKTGGMFIAMKGDAAAEELNAAKNALKILGCDTPILKTETLTGEENRAFIICKKKGSTPSAYPRAFSKIKKSPLK